MDYTWTLSRLGDIYFFQERYAAAESLYRRVLALRRKLGGTSTEEYAWALYDLANLYLRGYEQYSIAESLYRQIKQILTKARQTESSLYLNVVYDLAGVYHEEARYQAAEALARQIKNLMEKRVGSHSVEYANALAYLAHMCGHMGRYAEAEQLYYQAKEIIARALGRDYPQYAELLGSMSRSYHDQGLYEEAEVVCRETADIWGDIYGRQSSNYLRSLSYLAHLYYHQRRFAEAEHLLNEVKAAYEFLEKTDHSEYLETIRQLGYVYWMQERYEEAESLYWYVIRGYAKTVGVEHPNYLRTLTSLGGLYNAQKRYEAAESAYVQIREILREKGDTISFVYAEVLRNLGRVYYGRRAYEVADSLFLQVRGILEKITGKDHEEYYETLYSLAMTCWHLGRYAEADSLWRVVILRDFDYIRREFPLLPVAHREVLLERGMNWRYAYFQKYLTQRGKDNAALRELGYRTVRSRKGMLLMSVEAMKHLAERSQDSSVRRLYREWREVAQQHAALLASQLEGGAHGGQTPEKEVATAQKVADSLAQVVLRLEKALVRRLPALRRYFPDLMGEPLFPPLKPYEALIEMERIFEKDTVWYLFYLILPQGRRHRLDLHVERVDTLWEHRVRNAYEILRSPGSVISGVAYQMLWSFLDSLLPSSVRVVYFSPDGVYFQINVNALYDAQRGQFVADRYEVRYVASSRRLLFRRERFRTQRPVVIGNPDFAALPDSFSGGRVRSYRLFESGVTPLPGAEVEAKGIAEILGVEPVLGKAATERFMKELRSPQVLHVATHGYFLTGAKNPMLGGALLLAQVLIWDSLYPGYGVEDGRLTAQEAANLDLIGTELVVLSACETGLGEVGGEGLYGLQRAFLEAGAQRVITTLWPIDDEATRELMLSFYQNWVRRKRREGVDEVFYRTLRAFRQKHPHPYYWGAFVIMR